MKWLIPIVGLCVVFLTSGCPQEDLEPLEPPTNLRIEVAGADSLSITLTWDASPTEDIDGYVIRLGAVEVGRVTITSFTHRPTALGTYRVMAYREDDESSAIERSTALVIGENQGPVWWKAAPRDTGYSAYGWNEDGIGTLYSLSSSNPDNRPFIDFWMDTLTPTKGTDRIYNPREPDALGAPWATARETWLHTATGHVGEGGFTTLAIAPGPGAWRNYVVITDKQVYILALHTGYYVKILVTERKIVGHRNFRFKYGFQPVRGFRRLGNDLPA